MAALVIMRSDESGWLKLQNSKTVIAYTEYKAHQLNEKARTVFEARSQHDSHAPEFYPACFGVRRITHLTQRGVEAFNNDRTAEWVEFGAHAGGKTPVLRYRPYGHAMDIMEAETLANPVNRGPI